jgi:Fur family peroxide stress response transcriptional regulator|tara:strand:+ start:1877 stop:2266 length:390 start_codon:yes stop_codon:yes gene_type:complete
MKSRYSFARETILNIVKSTNTHPTANEIYREVALSIPHISLNTIYRNLRQLAKKKLIYELHLSDKTRYCGNLTPHAHLHCSLCHGISDCDIDYEVFSRCFNSGEFRVSDYYLEIKGVCKNCKKKNNDLY